MRRRPGTTTSINYTLGGYGSQHTIVFTGAVSQVTLQSHPGSDAGSIDIIVAAGAPYVLGSVVVEARALDGVTILDSKTLTLAVDPPPVWVSATPTVSIDEDANMLRSVAVSDDATATLTVTSISASGFRVATGNNISGTLQLNLQAPLDFFGTTQVSVVITDRYGPTTMPPLTVTVRPINDPPAVSVSAPATPPTMDPAVGTPVAVATALAIAKGVDADVTLAHTPSFLGFTATVDGIDGVDLLTLRGDAGYRVDATTIAVLPVGTTIATWARSGGDTRKLSVTGNAATTLVQLQELVRLLRFSHTQSPAAPVTRIVTITVSEPDFNGGAAAIATPVTCTCLVAAVNRPPVATLQPVVVKPGSSAVLNLVVQDHDTITVTVADPAPKAGTVTPASYTGSAASLADRFRYTPTAGDLSDDAITLSMSDGYNPPVLVRTTVAIRMPPDRLSIISDPVLEVVRGVVLTRPIRTVPAGATLSLADYGSPMPARQACISLVDGALVIDGPNIPATTAWLAVQVKADIIDASLSHGQSASQRMLIRVREPGDVTDN